MCAKFTCFKLFILPSFCHPFSYLFSCHCYHLAVLLIVLFIAFIVLIFLTIYTVQIQIIIIIIIINIIIIKVKHTSNSCQLETDDRHIVKEGGFYDAFY